MTAGGPASISNEQFVTEVVQRVLKALGVGSATGPLYAVDARLRPHGASGPLVLTLDAFRDYLDRSTQTWERMAFTRARVIFATGGFGQEVTEAVRSALAHAASIPRSLPRRSWPMRRKLEASRGRHDLKRGFGGLADLEFIVQYLQLVLAARQPDRPPPLRCCPDQLLGRARRPPPPRDPSPPRSTPSSRRLRFPPHGRGPAPPDPQSQRRRAAREPVELERLARRLNYESADPPAPSRPSSPTPPASPIEPASSSTSSSSPNRCEQSSRASG